MNFASLTAIIRKISKFSCHLQEVIWSTPTCRNLIRSDTQCSLLTSIFIFSVNYDCLLHIIVIQIHYFLSNMLMGELLQSKRLLLKYTAERKNLTGTSSGMRKESLSPIPSSLDFLEFNNFSVTWIKFSLGCHSNSTEIFSH